jgi:hypothetical protein
VPKLHPRRVKIESNAAFALKFGRAKKKSARRKARRARTIARETAWLLSVGIDPTESEAPVA